MKNFYFAVTVKENNKYYAYVIKANTSSNLKSTFNNPKFDNIVIFPTKKKPKKQQLIGTLVLKLMVHIILTSHYFKEV